MRTLFPYRKHCHASRSKRPAVASGSQAVAGRRWLVAVSLWLLMLPGLQAQIQTLEVSSDLSLTLDGIDAGSPVVFRTRDDLIIEIDPATQLVTEVFAIFDDAPSVDLDAYDGSLNAFSIDIDSVLHLQGMSVFVRAGEIYDADNGSLLFDPVAAGLPANTDIDAVSVDPATGDLLFSVEQFIGDVPGGGVIFPADIISWDGSSFGLFFDGLQLPRSTNVDAVHVLNDGDILMSFDADVSLPGFLAGTGGAQDHDIIRFNSGSFSFETDLADGDLDWFPADVDALSAVEGPTGFTIGGTVSGLAGSGLVLRNNGGDDLAISGNGGFTFATPVPDGDMYNVTVATQPSGPAQNCTVSNGSGMVSGANVTNVQVSCITGGQVQFASSVAEVMENEGPVTLTVNRIGGSDGATSFRVQTASGSATSGSDFTAVNQVLNWAAGDSGSRTVNITIIDDGAGEDFSENFSVTLSKESGSSTSGTPTTATVTIYDNETVIFADGFEGEP